ncbi:MAG: M2 family metallopeptidase [Gammaproteobacteria bacterium]|jgi:peptidyl-dipeptidase A|nr:M2 family metallopeptidase [Gammaproteobacteria bacterium]MDH3749871.1 M2 family metallopeptidase [Gammaproteobacteria bacterium]MDH3805015.1 M2 family metallopeptidase [Gammaproteobacteria bacterium]
MKDFAKLFATFVLAIALTACSQQSTEEAADAVPAETAGEFIARVNTEYKDWWRELNAAGWLRATYINEDSAVVDALANERYAAWHSGMVKKALKYDGQEMAPETRRALDIFKMSALLVAPDDDAKRKEQAQILTDLGGMYGAGTYCRSDDDCLSLPELEDIIAQSRDYDKLLEAWQGWRTISPPMRDKYTRFAELANEGAREFGYADMGDMWRSYYDMSSAEFTTETARLWQQVEPLYEELHCHVRAKLGEVYGEDKVPLDGPIPAHLLGNMWAQQWSFIYDLLEPYPGVSDLDVDSTLKTKDYSPQEMVRSAETFYASLGMRHLPDTFWERSMFSKPADRDVVCHASAWNLDGDEDLRIKMCIKQTFDELRTIYHELGHNYYQWAYNQQPMLFRDGAHGGFHEAIGDTVVLSMTPEYLVEVGLVAKTEQSKEAIINRQMQQALDRIAFLPFGKLIDEWRWGVFSGEIAPADYNKAWWELRLRYQGIAPPVQRTEANFDPGAKYHVPGNVSYTRYFLAHVLMFQFHRTLCELAEHEGDLHACSVFGSKEAGERFHAMLETGASVPWQDTLEKLTGTREMDASAIIDYFAPLMAYLKEQNEGRSCGW